jgi:hypothetical protein
MDSQQSLTILRCEGSIGDRAAKEVNPASGGRAAFRADHHQGINLLRRSRQDDRWIRHRRPWWWSRPPRFRMCAVGCGQDALLHLFKGHSGFAPVATPGTNAWSRYPTPSTTGSARLPVALGATAATDRPPYARRRELGRRPSLLKTQPRQACAYPGKLSNQRARGRHPASSQVGCRPKG